MADGTKIPNPRSAFHDIYEKAKSLGLEPKDLSKLESLDFIAPRPAPSTSKSYVLFVLVLIASGLYYSPPIPGSKVAEFFRRYSKPAQDFCLLDFHQPTVSGVFRRLENCDECRVSEVARVANITPEEFERQYAYSKAPVVVTDGMANWTAGEVFSYEYFKKLYKDLGRAGGCWFDGYKNFKSLSEVFEMSDERARMEPGTKPWYAGWSNCDPLAAAELRRHYTRPYFLPRQAESSKTDWIFMGSVGYGAPMHVDNVNHPSWQAQIRGHKLWTLKPPLECTYQCPTLQVTVHPGEIIVLDTNTWYHSTLIKGEEMSITIGSEFD